MSFILKLIAQIVTGLVLLNLVVNLRSLNFQNLTREAMVGVGVKQLVLNLQILQALDVNAKSIITSTDYSKVSWAPKNLADLIAKLLMLHIVIKLGEKGLAQLQSMSEEAKAKKLEEVKKPIRLPGLKKLLQFTNKFLPQKLKEK